MQSKTHKRRRRWKMFDPIIGGAVSAAIGALAYAGTALLIEQRHDKAKRLLIVDELIAETQENLVIAKSPSAREMWWMVPYKLEAYHAYKGQLFFLPEKVRTKLADIAFIVEGVNTGIRVHQLRAAFGQPVIEKRVETPSYLIEWLNFCDSELRSWQQKHKP
jgi:hypothetical protein